jgi:hypothetical protein
MLLVEHYLYLPGCCGFCRGINLPTIDTGIDLDHVNSPDDPNPGANKLLYICADCALEMARMVSESRNLQIVTAGSTQTLSDMVQQLSESNLKFVARIEELENALRVIQEIKAAPAPESSPTKKPFKVASPKDIEV